MSPRWTSYIVHCPQVFQRVAQKCKVSKIWIISCDNSETVQYRMSFVIITNRKSHTGFRLLPTSMTLNDLERRSSPYFAFFHKLRLRICSITSQLLKADSCKFRWRSVQGFLRERGSNFPLFHWLALSSLKHSGTTVSACDYIENTLSAISYYKLQDTENCQDQNSTKSYKVIQRKKQKISMFLNENRRQAKLLRTCYNFADGPLRYLQ